MAFAAPLLAAAGPLAAAATPLTIASTAMSAVGALQQGRAESQALSYNAMVADNNASIARQNATLATQQAGLDAATQDQGAAQEIGQIIAEATGSGLVGGSVSMRQIAARRLAAQDRLAIRQSGTNQARNFRQQARDLAQDASFGRASARNARTAGLINFGSSLISGATTVNQSRILALSAEQ